MGAAWAAVGPLCSGFLLVNQQLGAKSTAGRARRVLREHQGRPWGGNRGAERLATCGAEAAAGVPGRLVLGRL